MSGIVSEVITNWFPVNPGPGLEGFVDVITMKFYNAKIEEVDISAALSDNGSIPVDMVDREMIARSPGRAGPKPPCVRRGGRALIRAGIFFTYRTFF